MHIYIYRTYRYIYIYIYIYIKMYKMHIYICIYNVYVYIYIYTLYIQYNMTWIFPNNLGSKMLLWDAIYIYMYTYSYIGLYISVYFYISIDNQVFYRFAIYFHGTLLVNPTGDAEPYQDAAVVMGFGAQAR